LSTLSPRRPLLPERPIEVTDKLVAIHNLTQQKLLYRLKGLRAWIAAPLRRLAMMVDKSSSRRI